MCSSISLSPPSFSALPRPSPHLHHSLCNICFTPLAKVTFKYRSLMTRSRLESNLTHGSPQVNCRQGDGESKSLILFIFPVMFCPSHFWIQFSGSNRAVYRFNTKPPFLSERAKKTKVWQTDVVGWYRILPQSVWQLHTQAQTQKQTHSQRQTQTHRHTKTHTHTQTHTHTHIHKRAHTCTPEHTFVFEEPGFTQVQC